MTGWRLGWIIAPKPLAEAAKSIHDFLVVCPASPLMEAATVGLQMGEEWYSQLREFYNLRRELMLQGLDRIGINHTKPQGAYYVLIDIGRFGYHDDREFCEALTCDGKVAAVAGSAFFADPEINNWARLHFAKAPETIHEALNRLEAFSHRRARAK